MRTIFTCAYFSFASFLLSAQHAQLSSVTWEKVYRHINAIDNISYGSSEQMMQATSEGGYIFTGCGSSSLYSQNGIFLVKTNASGDITWSNYFYDSLQMISNSVLENGNGFLVAGYRFTTPNSIAGLLLKTDQNGNLLWSKTYPGCSQFVMLQASGNSIYALGQVPGYSGGISLFKLDASGTMLWNHTINTYDLGAKGMVIAPDGGIVVIGKKQSYTYGIGSACYLAKFTAGGSLSWEHYYSYTEGFEANVIRCTADGGFIIGGSMLMKVDANGALGWVKKWYYGSAIRDLIIRPNGSYVLVCGGSAPDYNCIQLCSLSQDLVPQWKALLGDKRSYATTLLAVQGGFVMGGGYGDQNFGGFYLLRTDSMGKSGCNPDRGTFPPYQLRSMLCISQLSNTSLSSNPSFSSSPLLQGGVQVDVADPCCHASPLITCGNYYPCASDTFIFYGTGGPSLSWSTGDTSMSIRTMDTLVQLSISNTCGTFSTSASAHRNFTPTFTYTVNRTSICPGDSVTLTFSGNAPAYYCYPSAPNLSPNVFILKPATTTTYRLIASTGNTHGPNCGTEQSLTITVTPDKPTISHHSDTLRSSSPSNNQWYFNSNPIPNASQQILVVSQPGIYAVEVSAPNGCTNRSADLSWTPDTLTYNRDAWVKMITSTAPGFGTGSCITETADGGLLVGSTVNHFQGSAQDIALVKTDRDGNVSWSKVYGGAETDMIAALLKIQGGYMVLGSTNSSGNGNMDVYVLRLDLQGNLLWSKTYGDWNDQKGASIEQTADGGFIITGSSSNPSTYWVDNYGWTLSDNDLYLLKIDGNGTMLWNNVFDTGENEWGSEVHETPGGGFIIAGTSEDIAHHLRVFMISTGSSGNLRWSKKIANTFFAETAAMKITPDNHYLVCTGASSSAYLLKLDTSGAVAWSKIAHMNSWGNSLTITNDNAAVFTSGFGYISGAMTKIDMNGDLVWSKGYSTGCQQYLSCSKQLSDGRFVLTGAVDTSNMYSNGQICLVSTDLNAETNCSNTFIPSITNENFTIISHTVNTYSIGQERNAVTIQYPGIYQSYTLCKGASPMTSVKETDPGFSFDAFPNPSDGNIWLYFSNTVYEPEVRIYDVNGKRLFDQRITHSPYHLDLGPEAKGLVLVEMVANGKVITKKIILQ